MAGGDLTEGACIPKKDRVPTSNPLELNPFDLCLIGKGNLLGGCWSNRGHSGSSAKLRITVGYIRCTRGDHG